MQYEALYEKIEAELQNAAEAYQKELAGFDGRYGDLAVAQQLHWSWAIPLNYVVTDEASMTKAVAALAGGLNTVGLHRRGEKELMTYAVSSANRSVLRRLFHIYKEVTGSKHPLHEIYNAAGIF